MRSRRRRGVSLVEVMVTIAILLTLMSLVGIGVFTTWEWSRVDVTRLTMGRIGELVEMYRLREGGVPRTSEGLGPVTGGEVPRDGWDRPLGYEAPHEQADYALTSLGRDGEPGGERWNADLEWMPTR
jgi:general secretion pathway protein G